MLISNKASPITRAGPGGGSLDVTWTDQDNDITNKGVSGNEYSFTVDIGAADPNRLVVVAVSCVAGASRSITQVTIGGNVAELYTETTSGTTYCVMSAIAGYKITTGTTTTVTVRTNNNVGNCTINVFRVITTQTAALADDYVGTPASDPNTVTIAMNAPVGGAVIMAVGCRRNAAGTTFSGTDAGTEYGELEIESSSVSAAYHKDAPSGLSAVNQSVDASSTAHTMVATAVAFAP